MTEEKIPEWLEYLRDPARRALLATGLRSPEQFADVTPSDLLRIHGFGRHALKDLKECLQAVGAKMGSDGLQWYEQERFEKHIALRAARENRRKLAKTVGGRKHTTELLEGLRQLLERETFITGDMSVGEEVVHMSAEELAVLKEFLLRCIRGKSPTGDV